MMLAWQKVPTTPSLQYGFDHHIKKMLFHWVTAEVMQALDDDQCQLWAARGDSIFKQ